MVGTQGYASCALGITTRCDKHLCTTHLGQLNRRHTNTAAAALQQQGLPCLQCTSVEHIAPHGKEGLGQTGGLHIRQAIGNGQRLRHRCNTILGIATARHQRAHAITHLQSCMVHRNAVSIYDDARHFQTQNIGGTRRGRIVPCALQNIGPVDATGSDANADLTCARHGHRPLPQAQNARSAKRLHLNNLHTAFDQ